MYNALFLFLIAFFASTLESYSQLSPEENYKLFDSITKTIDQNDPDFNEKMNSEIKKHSNKFKDNNNSDTNIIDSEWQTENLRNLISQGLKSEYIESEIQRDFYYMKPCLIIDMENSKDLMMIDSLENFTNLNLLIIKGNSNSKKLDLNKVFKDIENKEILELYIINFKDVISTIPESISKLKTLKVLGLYGNSINEIPKSICELENLEQLFLDLNPIYELPYYLKKLNNLTTIGIASTKISKSDINRFQIKFPQIKVLIK